MVAIAHTKNKAGQRHNLTDHLFSVADMAGDFARPYGAQTLAYYAGILHDIGKLNPAFQQYLLHAEANPTDNMRGPDHKGAGAALASRMQLDALAFLVAGHHGGLVASSKLKEWLKERAADPDVQQAIATAQSAFSVLAVPVPAAFPPYIRTKHEGELFIRMLFSALVDADFLDTERHFNSGQTNQRGRYPDLASLEKTFRANQDALMD
ncbi:MAG: CRISPR-associated endonuclease Cas3'', partial [Ktedonobacterales bacterium]